MLEMWGNLDLNQGPTGYESAAPATASQQLTPRNHSGKPAFRATVNCCHLSHFFVCQWSTNGPRNFTGKRLVVHQVQVLYCSNGRIHDQKSGKSKQWQCTGNDGVFIFPSSIFRPH